MTNTGKLVLLTATLWILNIFDALATYSAIKEGYATEDNPLMDAALSQGIFRFFMFKIALVTLGVIAFAYASRKHKNIHKVLIPLTGVYGLIACMHLYGFAFIR